MRPEFRWSTFCRPSTHCCVGLPLREPEGDFLWHSIHVHCNPADRHDNSILGREGTWRLAWPSTDAQRRDAIKGTKEALALPDFAAAVGPYEPRLFFPPNVFRQANLDQFTEIVKVVRKFVPRGSKVVELYGGVGTIGLHISDLVSSLNCSDENPFNAACFQEAAATLPPDLAAKLSYLTKGAAGMALDGAISPWEDRGGSSNGAEVVIVDPPRKGLDPEVLDALTATAVHTGQPSGGCSYPSRLIYISCGFKAFVRDASRLLGLAGSPSSSRRGKKALGKKALSARVSKWRIVHAEGHVLFPGADHVETVAIFERV